MASIDDILAVASKPENRREATVRLLLDKELDAEQEAANAEFERVMYPHQDEISPPEHVVQAGLKVDEVAARVEAAKVEFRFVALNGQQWLNLIGHHPPTKEQLKDNPLLRHNTETFPAAAIAASCVEPEMTEKQAKQLLDVLNPADYTLLWGTCWTLHQEGDAPKHPVAAGLIHLVNSQSERRATTTKRRGRSSSAES